MTKQEILAKLIAYYEENIKALPEENWKEFLFEKRMLFGICFCSEMVFGEKIRYEEWVFKRIKGKNCYWFNLPDLTKYRCRALMLLENRLQAMKEEILIVE